MPDKQSTFSGCKLSPNLVKIERDIHNQKITGKMPDKNFKFDFNHFWRNKDKKLESFFDDRDVE